MKTFKFILVVILMLIAFIGGSYLMANNEGYHKFYLETEAKITQAIENSKKSDSATTTKESSNKTDTTTKESSSEADSSSTKDSSSEADSNSTKDSSSETDSSSTKAATEAKSDEYTKVNNNNLWFSTINETVDSIESSIINYFYKNVTVSKMENVSNKVGNYDVLVYYENDSKKYVDTLSLYVVDQSDQSLYFTGLSHTAYNNSLEMNFSIKNKTSKAISGIRMVYLEIYDNSTSTLLCKDVFINVNVTIPANGTSTWTFIFNRMEAAYSYSKYYGTFDAAIRWSYLI